jgi:hypothetical protein
MGGLYCYLSVVKNLRGTVPLIPVRKTDYIDEWLCKLCSTTINNNFITRSVARSKSFESFVQAFFSKKCRRIFFSAAAVISGKGLVEVGG